MYTGIAETSGEVTAVESAGEGRRIQIRADIFDDIEAGDSICVSGVCLTAETVTDGAISCFAAAETLERSWFSDLESGDHVNLERPLQPDDRMGGHIVEGHVEASGEILDISELEEGWDFVISKPSGLDSYIVEKGYITIEGMSLTVTDVDADRFSVTIIPETHNRSNLSEKDEGDNVNLETDVVARYVEGMVQKS
ncbi:riboflavin synthase [Natrinema halophilum]|uniref:Riboflavin synthase n=1 Tax=Natrinema halophilum TaxID=1699371 RepID=A0A7D5KS46_9EURY|nr:riboflavin synthase [Natrinema halophilum]QLG49957.1 riboflavin synthase [Natrinema halophilum]